MRPGQIILALSNPESEIDPLEAMERGAAFAADGKGVNNVLAFPGLFRGALAAHAPRFTDAMLIAAADAIAQMAGDDLVPNPLDKQVHERVAAAVMAAALQPVRWVRQERPSRPERPARAQAGAIMPLSLPIAWVSIWRIRSAETL